MKGETQEIKMIRIRERIIDLSLIAAAIIDLIIFVFILIRALKYSFDLNFFLQTLIILTIVLFAFFRKRLPFNLKVSTIVALIGIIIITSLNKYGFLSSAKYYIALIPFLVSFVWSYKLSVASLAIYCVFYMLFAVLFLTGNVDYNFILTEYVQKGVVWIIDILVIFLTSFGLLYIGNIYSKTIISNYQEIEKKNQEIKKEEEKYRTLFDCSLDCILLLDEDLIFDCNKAALKLFSCDRDFILDRKPDEFSPPLQPDGSSSKSKAASILKDVYNGNAKIFEWKHIRPNGELFDALVSLNPVKLQEKTYVQAVIRDVTKSKQQAEEIEKYKNHLEALVEERTNDLQQTMENLKNAQVQLIQAEKMASLGILTAGVAHEINNPLNYIMGSYFGLKKYFSNKLPEHVTQTEYLLNTLKTGIDKASKIVKGLNEFSSDSGVYTEICDIHQVLDNCLAILRNKYEDGIEIEKNYSLSSSEINGNVGKLHQVFLSLLNNSIQAVTDNGKIIINTLRQDSNIRVEIIDNGCGIKEGDLSKITIPFFTTKDPGKGIGLGLSIAYTIVKEHKGSLNFKSKVGTGTTVVVTLPA